MDNIARAETVATEECTLSDEMISEIIEREKYMETHPDEWITAEESIKRLKELAACV